ncbi:MAG: AAA family ATPase [Candidatus Magnetobacterium sp. LHC-1]
MGEKKTINESKLILSEGLDHFFQGGHVKMKISSLIIRNFKGIKELTINMQGKSISIYGENGTGKTSIADAINWLLFGKDSLGNSKFSFKPLDESGNEIHYLETEVVAAVILDKPVNLRKVFSEKWTKKRGTATESFEGHTVDYYIDEVPKKEKEYQEYINAQLSEELFKLLANPLAFNNLPWQKRREIMLGISGDVSVLDVLNSNSELDRVRELLLDKSTDDALKMLASQKKKINDELKSIPVRISECNNSLPVLPESVDFNALLVEQQGIDELNDKLNKQRQEIQKNLDTDKKNLYDLINDHQEKISGLKTKNVEAASINKITLLEIDSINDQIKVKKNRIESNNNTLSMHETSLTSTKTEVQKLREEWSKKDIEKMDDSSLICPTCGQDLPSDQKETILSEFTKSRALSLAEITKKGQQQAENIKRYEQWISDIQDDTKSIESEIVVLQKQLTEKQSLIKNVDTCTTDTEIGDCMKVIDDLKSQLSNISVPESIKEIDDQIKAHQSRINEIDKLVGLKEIYTKTQSRINELKTKEKQLAAQYTDLEGQVFGVESFIKTKVDMLEGKLNSMFETVRFKLFETQINSGIKETFEVLVGGVPFTSGLNNGARINAGIEIINKLAEYYNFQAPIIIDNRESITKLTKTPAQTISLIVSEQDKTLRVV